MARPTRHHGKWRIRVPDGKGGRLSATFDTRAEALLALRRFELQSQEVKMGLREPDPIVFGFEDLIERWVRYRVPEKRSGKNDVSIINRHLRPAFGCLDLHEIDAHAVEPFVQTLSVSPKTIHNILTLLIAMLNYAFELGWITRVPRIRKPKIIQHNNEYRYLKTMIEIQRVLAAAQVEGPLVHALYSAAAFTGMRAGELAGLTWSCVDFERRLITVRCSYDGPTKNGEIRYVPILDALLPTLRAWRLQCPGLLVFPTSKGTMRQASDRAFQEVLHRVLERAGFAPTEVGGKLRRHMTFHGFRHTFASHWVMNGGDLFKLQQIGGWKSHAMVQRYAHLAPHAFEGDWGRFGERARCSANQDAKVTGISVVSTE